MSSRRIYIVDGYNVIRAGNLYGDDIEDWTDDFFNSARDRLINDVASFVGKDDRAYVVFDGKNNAYSNGEAKKVGRVDVIFSKFGVDADSEIIRLAILGRKEKCSVFVVTSDASIQFSTMGEGVRRMSACDFCKEISSCKTDISDASDVGVQRGSSQLGKMIDSATYEKLIAIRDGRDA